jgi:hypothetical protein
VQRQVGPTQAVPEGFVQHSPFYYIRRQLQTVSAKKRRLYYNYWARACGLTIVELKQYIKDAK